MLDETYVVSPHTRICQRFQRAEDEWQADQISIELVRGTIDRSDIDGQLYHLLRGTDGTRTLGVQFGELATMIKADVASVIPTGVQLALRLLRRGYILPAGWDPPQ